MNEGLGYDRKGVVTRVKELERKVENSAPPVGLEPTTSCFPGKHNTTVPRGRLQVVGDDSNPCAGGRYLNGQVWITVMFNHAFSRGLDRYILAHNPMPE